MAGKTQRTRITRRAYFRIGEIAEATGLAYHTIRQILLDHDGDELVRCGRTNRAILVPVSVAVRHWPALAETVQAGA